jgi:hypothetical protein
MEDKKNLKEKENLIWKKKNTIHSTVYSRVPNEIGRHSAHHLNRISLIINNQKLFPSSKKRNMSTRVFLFRFFFYCQTYFAKNPPILRSY